ncbi:MAG: hypothetical protein WA874_01495 [Chryseosolibacter sp.]
MQLNKNIVCSLLMLTFLTSFEGRSQAQHKISAIARAYGDSIVLRWAPGSAVAWEAANRNGFLVERYVLVKDGVLQQDPSKEMMTSTPLMPWKVERWKDIVQKDKYSALAAQALYGKTFQLTTGRMGDVSQVYQKVKESEARFSMALFAADVSAATAEASALRFTDKSVKTGERYLYRIYTPSKSMVIDTAFCYIGADDQRELPKPYDVQAFYTRKNAVITWDKIYVQDIYTAYIIERSDDGGKAFTRLNDLPLVNTNAEAESSDRAIYTDSLPALNKRYVYRVRGMNAFAETGPPSDTVSVIGHASPEYAPVITSAMAIDNNQVSVKWEFPKAQEKTIQEFQVERASKASGSYELLRGALDVKERQFRDDAPLTNGYYRVKVVGADRSERTSLPHLVQLIDSIPPSMPRALQGIMDSTGVVTLRWTQNNEADLRGYRVYRANFSNDEYFQVTAGPVSDTVYRDTLNVRTLTKVVYYKIVAIDHNFNPSDFSDPLELQRFDKLPPVPPVFRTYAARADGVYLEWQPSTSDDVVETRLLRRQKGSARWETIALFRQDSAVTQYFDREIPAKRMYEYTLCAYDGSDNASVGQVPISLQRVDNGVRPPVQDLKGIADRQRKNITLSWNYGDTRVSKFSVYRQIGDGPLTVYKTIPASEFRFVDKALRVNTVYSYRVKGFTSDGGESPFSDLIVVEY